MAESSLAASQCAELPRIEVQGADAECLTAAGLCERILAYLPQSRPSVDPRLVLELQLMAAEQRARLVLAHGVEPVATRDFEALPQDCSELRDLLALSMAVTIEHAASEPSRGARGAAPRIPTSAADRGSGERNRTPATEPHRASTQAPAGTGAEPSVSLPLVESSARDPQLAPATAPNPSMPAIDQLGSLNDQEPSARHAGGLTRIGEATRDDDAATSPPQLTSHAPNVWRVHAGGQAMLYALSSPLWLGAAGLEWMRNAFSLRFGAVAGGVAGLTLGRGQADISLVGAELHGCGGAGSAELLAQLCLGVLGAGVLARGHGFASDMSGASGWGAGVLTAAIRWPSTARIALQLSLRGLYNLARPALRVQGLSERLVWASVGASAGIELIFALP